VSCRELPGVDEEQAGPDSPEEESTDDELVASEADEEASVTGRALGR
jgi:hypothetical protein